VDKNGRQDHGSSSPLHLHLHPCRA
jgi:hypothetical protein